MNVFIGTADIADVPVLLQQGFHKLGLSADIGLLRANKYYAKTLDLRHDIQALHEATTFTMNANGALTPALPTGFRAIAKHYDLFIFVASQSLAPRLADLPALQAMGKTVVSYQTGSEIRHEVTGARLWNAYGHSFPLATYPTPRDANNAIPPWWTLTPWGHTVVNKTYNTRMAETFASVICTNPMTFSFGVRPVMTLQLPMDANLCTFRVPKRTVPVVVHAPSNRTFKRTDWVVAALQELANEGVPFHFRLLENMENAQVLQTLTDADVLIDQVGCVPLGRLGLEGLCSGCAVVSGNSGSMPWPPDRPALSVTPATLKERLRLVLTAPLLRLRLAAEGREYIERGYHSPEGAAQAILDAIEREKRHDFDYYPTAFTDFATASPEEHLPPFLQAMTLDVLKRYGTHPDTDLARLEHEGFVPAGSTHENVPRWDLSSLHRIGPWNWCAQRIPLPTFDPDHARWPVPYENPLLT